MVTPASFGGMVCATAIPAARFDASHNAVMNAFTRPSLNVSPLIGAMRQG
jgi:hypothetical protein